MATNLIPTQTNPAHESVLEIFRALSVKLPANPALSSSRGNQTITRSELYQLSHHFLNQLIQNNVNAGDRVVFITQNSPYFFPLLFACSARGAALVPLNPEWNTSEISRTLSSCEPKIVFLDSEFKLDIKVNKHCTLLTLSSFDFKLPTHLLPISQLPEASDEFSNAPAIIIFTSGSTSQSKGVVLTQRNLFSMARSIGLFYGYTSQDKFINLLPYHHINAPMVTGLCCLLAGAEICVSDLFGFKNAKFFWKIVQENKISVLSLTPSIMAILLKIFPNGIGDTPNAIRMALVGTAKLEASIWHAFEERFQIPCYQGYGLTETTTWISMTPMDATKSYSTSGIPVDCEIKLDTTLMSEMIEGCQAGEVVIKSPAVMKGYFNQKDLTQKVLKDGWFYSGDIGYLNPQGQLVIAGRLKNIIKRSGVIVLPDEIDEIAAQFPGVSEVKTIGMKDDILGEKVITCATWSIEPNGSALKTHLKENLSPHKMPDQILALRALPRNPIGKVDQKKLLNLLGGEMTLEIISTFDRYEYRRSPSPFLQEIKDLIQHNLTCATQLRFMGYWGVGARTEINETDRKSMERLARLRNEINEITQSDFCQFEWVLADIHGRCNSTPENIIHEYLSGISALAKEYQFQTHLLSDIWKQFHLDFESVCQSSLSDEFATYWKTFELREDFIRQAANRPFNQIDTEGAAKRYVQLCLKENKIIEEKFKGCVFFTFSPPKVQMILPKLPTLYWHSIKPGVALKPWFVD